MKNDDGFKDDHKMSPLDLKPTKDVKKSSTLRPGSARKAMNGSASKRSNTKGAGMPLAKYSSDQTDKIFDLERENMQLKCKENLLETEITKMKTKLKRIEELMRKKNSNQGMATVPAEI